MTEYLFYTLVTLLPIASLSGYWLGRKSQQGNNRKSQGTLSRQYFDGLNFLLNEQPDKAIDTFIQMLEVDSETIETHLALGNLYRKHGELDRAIRLHQNLIARPTLPPGVRKLSLMELGLDYMGAGLLDRAESIFNELLLEPKHKAASLQQLMLIYQQTKDWQKAVKVAEQLQSVDNINHAPEIANFYCELAEQQISSKQAKLAYQSLKRAVQIDPNCVRANIIRGQLALDDNQPKRALKYYRELAKQNPAFLAEVLLPLQRTFSELKSDKGYQEFLHNNVRNGAGISVALAYAEIIRVKDGDKQAAAYIASRLEQQPSLKGLLRLIELHLEHAQASARPSLEILYKIINRSFEQKPKYRCDSCGFSGKQLFWQCPSCKSWGAVKPILGLEGE
ncbi:MAG: lipopolysaccharide assembly protein LapB [Kangiellaceae bacterium]|jgi:lipopolysaccharide biosynthesis regulator YciM|nr:lipopolysaccharide assembly protein LapB [Kangiellaceae bacterium]